MRTFLTGCGVAAIVIAAAMPMHAQYGRPDGPYRPEAVSALIDRVHDDLNRGFNVWHLSRGDRDRLDSAERQLRNFAKDWYHGRFGKADLDRSIGSIQHVLDDNRLRGRERDALWDDVTQLRRMREAYDRHEIGRW
jgi:hypothetical protein